MKSYLYKLLFLVFLIPSLSFAGKRSKYMESKRVFKSVEVIPDALLKVTNKYGKIDIITWDKNTTEIEVIITVGGGNKDDVLDKLDQIEIDISVRPDMVMAHTVMENESWSLFKWFSHKSFHIDIDYTIKIPKSNRIDLENDYGDIYVTELLGVAKINCDYGRIIIGDLHADNNEINLDYCSGSSISWMKSGHVTIDYSSLTIEKSNKVILNAGYSTSRLEEVEEVDFKCDYGKINISHARNIKGYGDYLLMRIGTISNSLDLNCDYGALRIDDIQEGFDQIRINSEYTNIKLGIHPEASFNLIADLNYCSLKNTEGFEFHKEIIKNTSKFYEGHYGLGEPKGIIILVSEFGSINFIRN